MSSTRLCRRRGCSRVRHLRGFCLAHVNEWCREIPPGEQRCIRCGLVSAEIACWFCQAEAVGERLVGLGTPIVRRLVARAA